MEKNPKKKKTITDVKLWCAYFKDTKGDPDWYFLGKSYWECRINELIATHKHLDKLYKKKGIIYKKVLTDSEGMVVDEKDFKM